MHDNANAIIDEIFRTCRTIAVVGASANATRPSNRVAGYMKARGYRMIPINPNETTILGEQVYPSLAAIPDAIDLVDVFRKAEDVLPIVDEAIAKGAKAIWLQEGIVNEAAAVRAKQAGLLVVMDRCWLKEHTARLNRGSEIRKP
ncbi:MAG TPA: CoA-binding protein [Nitrospira sp.]|nr:CoA-binding protein [Nitrospira sp.]